jgi:class 3 adenylate cyclase
MTARRAATLDRRIFVPVWNSAGAPVSASLIDYQPADPTARRFAGRLRPMPRFVPTARGIEVDYPGDGKLVAEAGEFRVLFPSCDDALNGAREAAKTAADMDVPLQIGVHHGAVHLDDNEEITGAVIVASEIGALARPGEILVSQDVRANIGESSSFSFEASRQLANERVTSIQLYALR